jgi:hypothetical protein
MGLSVTEDGCFLAYKTVNSDYTDKYSGTVDNTPGTKPDRMKRSQVDDNPRNHCSKGYHVGALGYAGPGGWYNSPNDIVLICKVNPADVVSVPDDHSCQKMRCCYYEPVGEFQGELKSSVYSGRVGDNYQSEVSKVHLWCPEPVNEYDLMEDNFYIGMYTKLDGTRADRYFLVEENNSGSYTVLLCEPEENAGSHRTFLTHRLTDVRTWDGQTHPYKLDNPYEEEELCDNCGDNMDDCCGDCYGHDDDDDDGYDYDDNSYNYW